MLRHHLSTLVRLFPRTVKIAICGLTLALSVDSDVYAQGRFSNLANRVSNNANAQQILERKDTLTATPWQDQTLPMNTVQNQIGQASGGLEVKVLETRTGTFTNNGNNGVSIGAAAEAHLLRVRAEGEAKTGSITVQNREVLSNTATGSTEIYIGARSGAEAGVFGGKDPAIKAFATANVGQFVNADGRVETKVLGGGLGLNGNVTAGVGAEGFAGMNANKEGTKIGLSGFAGDRASATGGVHVMGIGAAGTAEGWAGVGAELSATAGINNGKLRVKGDVGAALGVGGKLSFDVTVDGNQVVNDFQTFGNNVAHFGNQAGQQINRDFNRMGQRLSSDFNKAGRQITNDFNNLGNRINNDFNKAGNQISRDFNNAGKQMEQGFSKLKFW
jgi:hypothetical protein